MPLSFAHSNNAEVRLSLEEVVVPPPSADAVTTDRDVSVAGGDEDVSGDDGAMTNAAASHNGRLVSLHRADSIIVSTYFRRGVALLVLDGPIAMLNMFSCDRRSTTSVGIRG
jgi:hypothetical protein